MATYNFVEASGLIVPDTADLLEDVNNEYRAVFGEDFTVDPETPEGALIVGETTSRQSVARNNAAVANQINPNLAGGPFLDAIWALTGGERNVASRSTVGVTMTGVSGTAIPVGSVARTVAGDEFRSVGAVVIPIGGSIAGVFESVETGPIAAGIATLTTIVDRVLGWETVTNAAAATLGQNTETDGDSRNRRRGTLAVQGRGTALAVSSNLAAVVGVRSHTFRENVESTTEIIDGISLVAHSVWAAVQGGTDADVAAALLEAKGAGANWNGAVSVPVVEPASGQTFTVRFARPTARPVLVRVTVRLGATQSTDPTPAVRSAILAYANGDMEGEDGFVVGGDVSPFELSAAVGRRNPELFVTLTEIAFNVMSPVYVTTTLAIALDELATIEEADIQVLTV